MPCLADAFSVVNAFRHLLAAPDASRSALVSAAWAGELDKLLDAIDQCERFADMAAEINALFERDAWSFDTATIALSFGRVVACGKTSASRRGVSVLSGFPIRPPPRTARNPPWPRRGYRPPRRAGHAPCAAPPAANRRILRPILAAPTGRPARNHPQAGTHINRLRHQRGAPF
jgi:hypothetical protein